MDTLLEILAATTIVAAVAIASSALAVAAIERKHIKGIQNGKRK